MSQNQPDNGGKYVTNRQLYEEMGKLRDWLTKLTIAVGVAAAGQVGQWAKAFSGATPSDVSLVQSAHVLVQWLT